MGGLEEDESGEHHHCPIAISASHAVRRVARHGVRSHPVPVALVGELLHPGGEERRAPAAFVVPRELEVEALSAAMTPTLRQ
jgi:hypothetical protein